MRPLPPVYSQIWRMWAWYSFVNIVLQDWALAALKLIENVSPYSE